MIRVIGWLVAGLLGLAGCQEGAPAGDASAQADDYLQGTHAFGPKQRMHVRLAMKATADGGRIAPIHGGYRPTMVFAGGQATICAVDKGGLEQFPPGSIHEVSLRCTDAVTVTDDALTFAVLEDGREVGSGEVLP